MEVRLAALAILVKNMQDEMRDIVQNERELVHADVFVNRINENFKI